MRSATSACTMTTRREANGGPALSRWRSAGEVTWYGRLATTTNGSIEEAGRLDLQHVGGVDADVAAPAKLAAQRIGQVRVDLDRHDALGDASQPLGQHAQTGADFEDVGRRASRLRRAHDRRGDLLIVQERLRQAFARAEARGRVSRARS